MSQSPKDQSDALTGSEAEEDSVVESAGDCSGSEGTEDNDAGLVNHLYELFTNAQGTNVTEAILTLQESLEKTNKILYKIANTISHGLPHKSS